MGNAKAKTESRRRETARVLELIRDYESPNVTFMAPDRAWPIVWAKARGWTVEDVDGRKYLDFTAAFGVAAAGHANPRVVAAGSRQMRRLTHAMGDVHPHALKADLVRELSRRTFERWTEDREEGAVRGRTVLGNSGFEAVEAALKTAILATGRRGVVAFERGYHGLGYGALNLTHRDLFRLPFLSQLGGFGVFLPFPEDAEAMVEVEQRLAGHLARGEVGAVLVEPVQARGGIRVPPRGFLRMLRDVCRAAGVLLILDEVYTGFGRTGTWFACEHEGVVPDLICLGKALSGGYPLSACVGRADLMEAAWPKSRGEAIHTSTFLGNPVGCAMALAQIREIERLGLVEASARRGRELMAMLSSLGPGNALVRLAVRGRGLMVGMELIRRDGRPASAEVWQVVEALLGQGFLVLPEGELGEVISFTPPLIIRRAHLAKVVEALREILEEM